MGVRVDAANLCNPKHSTRLNTTGGIAQQEKKRHIRGKKIVSPIGRVLFPGVEARGLRKLQSLLSSWLPKKTKEVCDNLEDGESGSERYKTAINQKN